MTTHTSFFGKIWNTRGEKKKKELLSDAFFRVRQYTKKDLQPPSHQHFSCHLFDIEKTVERILTAKEKNETIFLFGDFDLDGASGVATLYFAMKSVGIHPLVKLPSRAEGYGLQKKSYDEAKTKNVDLLITVDCGSSSGDAISYGNSLGIETIVTDHHTLPSELPPAFAVVHPHRGDPTDSTWHLTGAGVTFFVGKALLEKVFPNKNISSLLNQLAELAVLGTVADVGQLVNQNRLITQIGLKQMKETTHPGLRELLTVSHISPDTLSAESIAFFLAPRLNAAGRIAHPHVALRLLLGDASAAKELEALNIQRRETTNTLVVLAHDEITDENAPCFFLFHPEFFSGIAGLIASALAEKYNRPVLVFSQSDNPNMLTASCRGPDDFHIAKALKKTSHLLEKHGGHVAAAGLSIQKKNVPAFQKEFSQLVQNERGSTPKPSTLLCDFSADIDDFFHPTFEKISLAAPFGVGNPNPLFLLKNVQLHHVKKIGKDGTHLAGEIEKNEKKIPFVAFRLAPVFVQKYWKKTVDVVVSVEKEIWRGREKMKAKIVDIRLSTDK